MRNHADVVVVGAGIVGALCAYRLAKSGLDVAMVDGEGVGSGSSGHGHGVLSLAGTNFRSRDHLMLGIESSKLYVDLVPSLIEDSGGIDPLYHELPGLALAVDEDEERLFRSFEADFHDLVPMEWITTDECRRIEPRIAPSVRGAFLYPFGQIDGYLTSVAATQAVERLGGRLVSRAATGLRVSGGRVEAVLHGNGEIACEHVVLAMGANAYEAGEWLGWDVPVRPYYGEVLHVRMPDGPPKAFIMTATHGPILPRRDGIVMVGSIGGAAMRGRGMSNVGIDFASREGSWYSGRPTDETRDLMITRAVEAMPALEEAELVEHLFGWRPMTPDQIPLLGTVPGFTNAHLAAGGGTKGIHLAPICAQIIYDFVTKGGTTTPGADATAVGRFTSAEHAASA